jgi:hypothetical protein
MVAARLIETAREYPSAVGEGERALITELGIVTAHLRREVEAEAHATAVWREAAYRWREKWLAVDGELSQAKAELAMLRVLTGGEREDQAHPRPVEGEPQAGDPGTGQGSPEATGGAGLALTRPGVAQDAPAGRG